MRLKTSKIAAEELLTEHLNNGYILLNELWSSYKEISKNNAFNAQTEMPNFYKLTDAWLLSTMRSVASIFPTQLEVNELTVKYSSNACSYTKIDQDFGHLVYNTFPTFIERLKKIITDNLPRYTDAPLQERLYIEDIDSFHKVRDINPSMVSEYLNGGYLDLPENHIQLALEQILDVSLHKKDWGGEIDDLYSANLLLQGRRVASSFLLKGNGLKRAEMQISDCGKNGDQILRLFTSPAQLYIIQYVGNISQSVIADVAGKVREQRAAGKTSNFLIIDGQDTARILLAYRKFELAG